MDQEVRNLIQECETHHSHLLSLSLTFQGFLKPGLQNVFQWLHLLEHDIRMTITTQMFLLRLSLMMCYLRSVFCGYSYTGSSGRFMWVTWHPHVNK